MVWYGMVKSRICTLGFYGHDEKGIFFSFRMLLLGRTVQFLLPAVSA